MSLARVVTLLAVVAVFSAAPVSAQAASSGRSCASYPTPGSVAPFEARTPPELVAEYGVLGQARGGQDEVTRSELGRSLPASGLMVSRSRFLGILPSGGRAYLVPAQHLLAFRLAPDRCLPRAERGLERRLRPVLRREYKHHALCLVVVYAARTAPSCNAAPATVDPLLFGAGDPGFGLVPTGVSGVVVHYAAESSQTIVVRRNFWVINSVASSAAVPCGLDWLEGGIVVRVVKRCSNQVDTDDLSAQRPAGAAAFPTTILP